MNIGTLQLTSKEFRGFQKLIFDQAGIHMSEAKSSLVGGRLAKRVGLKGLGSYGDYLKLIEKDAQERQAAVDLLTTNETYFFREPAHFDHLANQIAPSLRNNPEVRVWCGASSSGEEPYTIAMVLAEALGPHRYSVLASDISTRMLDAACRALYPMEDAANIPRSFLAKYALKGVGSQEGWFTLDRSIKDRVRFEQINLNSSLPAIGLFDVIFLRNVMIYFSVETKQAVVRRILPHLKPGGYFIISHSESLHGITDALTMVKPSMYRKQG